MAEKLAEWRGCIAQLVNLENAKCTGRSQEALSIDDAEVAHVLSSLHRLVESLAAAGELRDVLDRDVTSANLVLRFLAEQSHEVLGFNAAGKALKAILQVPSWKEMFELWGLQHAVSQECRFKLSKEGILVEERHSKKTSFLDRDHSETTHGLLRHELYETAQQLAERGARIVVLGDRGTGKSSLCNAAFGRQLAQTGVGRSVTQLITLYPATESCPVNLYDTKGFETDGDQLEQLKKLVEERRRASERHNVEDPARVSELLHLVWWVVDVISGGRFNPGHMQKVCSLLHKNGIPVIIVLNKCDAPEDFVRGVEAEIQKHCSWSAATVQVVADARLGPPCLRCQHEACQSNELSINVQKRCYACGLCGKSQHFRPSYGIEALIQETARLLPDLVAASFLRAQEAWLEGLDWWAQAMVASYTASAAALAAVPVPFASRALCVPVQVAMVLSIAGVYRVAMSRKAAVHLCSSIAGTGISIPACMGLDFLKLVPGFNVPAVAAEAAALGATTAALGWVATQLLRDVRSKALLNQVGPEELARIMDVDQLQQMFQNRLQDLRN